MATTESQSEFGTALQRARAAKGLTRGQVSKRVGLDPSHLFRIENGGRRPSHSAVLKLAFGLGMDDEAVNDWLVLAGFEPIAGMTAVRKGYQTQGAAADGTDTGPVSRSRQAAARAARLQSLGLTDSNVSRLLDALESVDLATQTDASQALAQSFARITESLESVVRTAIIPAAGGQHRMLAAHVMQRLLLASIAECAAAGIRDIILVLAPESVNNLYAPLKAALDLSVIPAIRLHACEQAIPVGLGAAILEGWGKVTPGPTAVVLPDDFIRERAGRPASRDLRQMLRTVRIFPGASLVAISPALKSAMAHAGVARIERPAKAARVYRILALAEKPGPGHPILSSRQAHGIVGRYVLQPAVFEALRELGQPQAGPLELTSALQMLVSRSSEVLAYDIESRRDDLGAMLGPARDLIQNVSR